MENEEQWLPIAGYEGKYEVSDNGAVRTFYYAEPKHIALIPLHGYLIASLYRGGKNKNHRVHRLVAEAFIPNPENKKFVNHKDGNKLNNTKPNLEWATGSENTQHYLAMVKERGGTWAKERSKSKQVYCPEDDVVIKSIAETSKVYGLDKSTIKAYIKTGHRTKLGKSFKFYSGQRTSAIDNGCNLSDSQLIEKCRKWVNKLATSGGRDWVLRVPADYNEDPDLLFMELINRFKLNNPH